MKTLSDKLDLLTSYKTTEPDKAAKNQLCEWASSYLTDAGLEVDVHWQEGLPSIFASSRGFKKTRVILQAHLDVVPAQDELFVMQKTGDKLVGRGVFDMKFAAACYLQLLDDLKSELNKYDFGIVFTFDEEVGGENGVASLLEHGYSADVCILPDGGDNWQIEESCNSVWIVKVSTTGCSAHGSRPWEGENAITKLTDCISLISKQFSNKKYGNTLTVSQISGGSALNQVPDEAWATLDMRFKDEANYIKSRSKVEKMFNDAGLQIETVAHVGATQLDKKNHMVKSYIDLAKEIAPVKTGFTHSLGSSDAHYFESRGIPTILMRPRGGGAHSDHEWISESDLEIYYQLIKTYIEQNARIA